MAAGDGQAQYNSEKTSSFVQPKREREATSSAELPPKIPRQRHNFWRDTFLKLVPLPQSSTTSS